MSQIGIIPFYRAIDTNGDPIPDARLYTFLTGTTVPEPVYTTPAMDVSHGAYVQADANGLFPPFYPDATKVYRYQLRIAPYTSAVGGYDVDPVTSLSAGGVSFLVAYTGGALRTAQDKLSDFLHARDFGAVGDGIADDTEALVNLIAAMRASGRPGMLGGDGEDTRHLIDCGALEWTFSNDPVVDYPGVAGPTLYTSGRVVLVAKSGSPNAPFISIHNDPDAGGHYIHTGFIGPLIFEDTTADVGTSRHGIELYGVQGMRFAQMLSSSLKGDLVRVTSPPGAGLLTGDAWHVSHNIFEGLTTVTCAGWTLNNDSLSQFFNFNHIGFLLAIDCRKGAWRGPGACNFAERVSTGWTDGWAIDWTVAEGHVQNNVVDLIEMDSPEYGMRLNGMYGIEARQIRVSHRYNELGGQVADTTNCWPKIVFQIGNDLTRSVVGFNVERAVHFVRASVTAPHASKLGTLVDFASNDNLREITIKNTTSIQNGGVAFDPAKYVANALATATGSIVLDGKPVFANTNRELLQVRKTSGNATSNYATRVVFDNVQTDQAQNTYGGAVVGGWDASSNQYVIPAKGIYLLSTWFHFDPEAGDLIRVGFELNGAGTPFKEWRGYAKGSPTAGDTAAEGQSFGKDAIVALGKGDKIGVLLYSPNTRSLQAGSVSIAENNYFTAVLLS